MSAGEKDEEPMEILKKDTISELFDGYAVELEHEYDLFETLVKKSRDVTYESKKIIFLLHRVENKEVGEKFLNQAKERLRKVFLVITEDIGSLLKRDELFKYIRAFRCGIEEFVEAASFYYYLMFGTLLSFEKMLEGEFLLDKSEDNASGDKKGLNMTEILTFTDYMLAILDLTGELMRKCINTKNPQEPFLICDLLRNIALSLNNVDVDRSLNKKFYTLKESLLKVEKVCSSINVRNAELEKVMEKGFSPSEIEDFKRKIMEAAMIPEPEQPFNHGDFSSMYDEN